MMNVYWIQSPLDCSSGIFTEKHEIRAVALDFLKRAITPMVVIAWGEIYQSDRPPLLKRTWIFQKRTTLQSEPVEVDDGLGGQLTEQVFREYIDEADFLRSAP